MVMQNYLELAAEKPTRLHFTEHAWVDRAIIDPETRFAKKVRTLVLMCDRCNNGPVSAPFSILAKDLQDKLAPYLDGNRYRGVDFIITRHGSGFQTRFEVQTLIRA